MRAIIVLVPFPTSCGVSLPDKYAVPQVVGDLKNRLDMTFEFYNKLAHDRVLINTSGDRTLEHTSITIITTGADIYDVRGTNASSTAKEYLISKGIPPYFIIEETESLNRKEASVNVSFMLNGLMHTLQSIVTTDSKLDTLLYIVCSPTESSLMSELYPGWLQLLVA